MLLIIVLAVIVIVSLKKTGSIMFFNTQLFSNLLSESESTNSYTANYKNLAFGKYQFIISRLQELHNKYPNDLPEISLSNINDFIDNPSLQEKFFSFHIKIF